MRHRGKRSFDHYVALGTLCLLTMPNSIILFWLVWHSETRPNLAIHRTEFRKYIAWPTNAHSIVLCVHSFDPVNNGGNNGTCNNDTFNWEWYTRDREFVICLTQTMNIYNEYVAMKYFRFSHNLTQWWTHSWVIIHRSLLGFCAPSQYQFIPWLAVLAWDTAFFLTMGSCVSEPTTGRFLFVRTRDKLDLFSECWNPLKMWLHFKLKIGHRLPFISYLYKGLHHTGIQNTC